MSNHPLYPSLTPNLSDVPDNWDNICYEYLLKRAKEGKKILCSDTTLFKLCYLTATSCVFDKELSDTLMCEISRRSKIGDIISMYPELMSILKVDN